MVVTLHRTPATILNSLLAWAFENERVAERAFVGGDGSGFPAVSCRVRTAG